MQVVTTSPATALETQAYNAVPTNPPLPPPHPQPAHRPVKPVFANPPAPPAPEAITSPATVPATRPSNAVPRLLHPRVPPHQPHAVAKTHQTNPRNKCAGGDYIPGYCPGDSTHQCCPEPSSSPTKTTTCKPPGKTGVCQKTSKTCDGGAYISGYCPGDDSIKCCPDATPSPSAVGGGGCWWGGEADARLLRAELDAGFCSARTDCISTFFGCGCASMFAYERDRVPTCMIHIRKRIMNTIEKAYSKEPSTF